MLIENSFFKQATKTAGLTEDELKAFFEKGSRHEYQANEWLFQESTPSDWGGVVLEGEIELIRGLHGKAKRVATMVAGSLINEGAFVGEDSHNCGAVTRCGAVVWQISKAEIDCFRKENPDLFYRIIFCVSVAINRRLRMFTRKFYDSVSEDLVMSGFRMEHDSLGKREVSDDAYFGIQTQRAMENFAISGVCVSNFDHMVEGLAMVKKAAALANNELGVINDERARTICDVCDELLAGKLREHFAVDMFQGGAGTSTNMNANEVIANRGLELMGHAKGEYQYLHPNDHVNCSQSTNDSYPTAIKLSVLLSNRNLIRSLEGLRSALEQKASEFGDVLKMGRTENQDAVPMTLGQEFNAYAVMVDSAIRALERSAEEFLDINMGATAIGTGITSPPGYSQLVTERLAEVSGFPLRKARNLIEATQNAGAFVQMSAAMKRAAVQISKICKDLRWMSSGPRCGLNEINLPPMQPGSSIMPGKVNPVIPEMVNQVCYQVVGYDSVVSMAAEASELELCMAEPLIAYDLLHGMMILKNACISLASRCIVGIQANRDICRRYVENSIGLVTALVPVIGYETSAAVAKEALQTGGSVYELVLKHALLSKEELDDMLRPESMTDPRRIPGGQHRDAS